MIKFRSTCILLLLGFSSGLPLALTSGTLQAWMTVENIDLKTIGFFSLVGQAYVFKFLWSPMMDRYSIPILGRRRGWLLITQMALIILIALLGGLSPHQHLAMIALIAVLIAFCSASQDIVFDAWKTDSLPAEQRGNGAAMTVLGYRVAMLVSGGLALWLADRYLGWQMTYWLMAALMALGLIGTYLASEPQGSPQAPVTLQQAILTPLAEFFSRNNAWLMITLIVLYKLGDAFASALTTSFLIRGLGFSAGDVGIVNKSLGLLATIIGALLGGYLMQRLSLYRALFWFGLLQGISNLAYWLLTITTSHLWSMGSAVFIENLCGGLGTAAFVALLMVLCHRGFSATQFALLSALSAIGRVYVGPVAGELVQQWGWSAFYAFSFLASFPGILLLYFARNSLNLLTRQSAFPRRLSYLTTYAWVNRCFIAGVCLVILALIISGLPLVWPTAVLICQMTWKVGLVISLGAVLYGVVLDCLSIHSQTITTSEH